MTSFVTTSYQHGALFILGTLRGLGGSISEFLMDATLISCGIESSGNLGCRKSSAGALQSSAATCRNTGSALGGAAVFLFLLMKREGDEEGDFHVRSVLMFTSMLLAAGSILPFLAKETRALEVNEENENEENEENETVLAPVVAFFEVSSPSVNHSSLFRYEILTIISLQFILVWSIAKYSFPHPKLWLGILMVLFSLFLFGGLNLFFRRKENCVPLYNKKIALFLLLYCSSPNLSYSWTSYVYNLYKSSPISIQVLNLSGSVGTWLGSILYGRANFLLSHHNSWQVVRWGILGGCIANAACSIGMLPVVSWDNDTVGLFGFKFYTILFPLHILASIVGEMAFLPLIVAATMAVDGMMPPNSDINAEEEKKKRENHEELSSEEMEGLNEIVSLSSLKMNPEAKREGNIGNIVSSVPCQNLNSPTASFDISQNLPPLCPQYSGVMAFQYGVYVACIDFGGQIGTWVSVPILSWLGLDGEDWSRMGNFLWICITVQVASLVLLGLLHGPDNSDEYGKSVKGMETMDKKNNTEFRIDSRKYDYTEVV